MTNKKNQTPMKEEEITAEEILLKNLNGLNPDFYDPAQRAWNFLAGKDKAAAVLSAMEEYTTLKTGELTKQRDRYWNEKQDQAITILEQREQLEKLQEENTLLKSQLEEAKGKHFNTIAAWEIQKQLSEEKDREIAEMKVDLENYRHEFNKQTEAYLANKGAPRFDIRKVTRVEVIDEKGRSYVNWKPTNKVEIHFQDNDRTLKIFVSPSLKDNPIKPDKI